LPSDQRRGLIHLQLDPPAERRIQKTTAAGTCSPAGAHNSRVKLCARRCNEQIYLHDSHASFPCHWSEQHRQAAHLDPHIALGGRFCDARQLRASSAGAFDSDERICSADASNTTWYANAVHRQEHPSTPFCRAEARAPSPPRPCQTAPVLT
jgi:hypothetical protein